MEENQTCHVTLPPLVFQHSSWLIHYLCFSELKHDFYLFMYVFGMLSALGFVKQNKCGRYILIKLMK